MSSQTDLDQGGTARHWVRTYLGPSVGWVLLPGRNPFPISAAGSYLIQPDTSLVTVNVNGVVNIILPTSIDPSVPAGVQPALFAKTPITIVDIGGFAQAHPITLIPFSGSENIMGLASIQITANYGAVTLEPSSIQKGWTPLS